jgi:diketogulonate reductase-like aldo/keto reductase
MERRNGIPVIGLGTYPLRGTEAQSAIAMALELGIRHIDTAQMYGNESDVGQAIKASGIPRSELFLVTKVDPGNIGKQQFASSVARSMDDLGSPADLLLIHWPPPADDFDAALERLLAEKQKGMARAIGVSNFSAPMMRRAQALTGGAIVCNQVEFHPLLDQSRLLAEAAQLGIALTAYSPLARGRALKHQIVLEVARHMGRPSSEVVLRWIIQQGVVAIPMTTKPANALSNLRVLEFELSDSDMALLSAIGASQGRTINPSWMSGRWEDGLK